MPSLRLSRRHQLKGNIDERRQDQGQPRECSRQHRPKNCARPRPRGTKRASSRFEFAALFRPDLVRRGGSAHVRNRRGRGQRRNPPIGLPHRRSGHRFAPRTSSRNQFLTDRLNDEYYESRANRRTKLAFIFKLLRPNAPDIPMPALSKYLTSTPQGPEKLATILSQEAKQLMAMDRYEKRALSRRKFAIREFDTARCKPEIDENLGCIMLVRPK